MNHSILSLIGTAIAILGLQSGCHVNINLGGETLVGSGVSITETRETEPFTGFSVGGAIKVEATIGETQAVEVSGDDNIVPLVTTEVSGGVLKIQTEHNGRLKTEQPLLVKIVATELDNVEISGACEVDVDGLSGSGFDAEVSGASTLTLSGSCERLSADVSGASTLHGEALQANEATVNASGASSVRVKASESIRGEASGASSVKYSGDPQNVKLESSGASSVRGE